MARIKIGRLVKGVTLGLIACAVSATMSFAEPQQGGSLNMHTTGYRTLNPGVQSGAATGGPGSQLFAGLVLVDKDYEIQPYLAKSWKISEDQLTVTFNLAENARFHDGEPITGEDVKFSFETVTANHPFGPAMFSKIKEITVPEARKVQLKLSQPVPGLLLSLQPLLMPILPKHIFDDGQDMKTHPRNMENVIGSGPFKLEENNPAERLTLVRNDDFFLEEGPYLDRLVYQLVKDPLTRVLMMEKGEIDYAPFSGIRPNDAQRLEKVDNLTITTDGYEAIGYIHYLELNLRKEEFAKLEVRQALSHAIDTDFVARILFGGRIKPGTGPLHTGNPYYSADVTTYDADMEKAASLLDGAGYPVGSDGKRFAFVLDIPSWATQAHVPMAEYIQAQLAKLDIEVELRRAPDFGTWVKRVSSWEYDATMNGSFNYPDPTIGVHRHFKCDNIRNVIWSNTQGYCDEEVDALLDKAAVETDQSVRAQLYADLQRKISTEIAKIYMPQDFSATVYNARVKNLPDTPFGALAPLHKVYLEN